jgi:biofilm PGA synthesis N-glycosyltransferase PgaC
MATLDYVLVTPARNEEAFLEATIKAVVAQTIRPTRWVIVSDGSTDRTDQIAEDYARQHAWIEFMRMPARAERHFGGKVGAFTAGYARVRELPHDVIGNLDADITFEPDYMAFLLDKFAANPRLGVAGTPFREGGEQYDYRFASADHVSGACQLFRRTCFEEIGGYRPLRQGGVDLAAVITARMRGWHTRSFVERTCEHHKKTQAGRHSTLKATFRSGYHDYLMGTHSLWHVSRSFYHMTRTPMLLGGAALLAGYSWAALTRVERLVPDDFVRFRREEQLRRLSSIFGRFLRMSHFN